MNLCAHPTYITPLQLELAEAKTEEIDTIEQLPLLDSFLKESARLNGSEWSKLPSSWHPLFNTLTLPVSGRRKALKPFTFSDGLHVPVGSWIQIPTGCIHRDAENYLDPLRFDGFRFVRDDSSRFTDVSSKWLIWGTGRVIW